MKRYLCLFLILCMVPACSFAVFGSDYLEDLDIYAELFDIPTVSTCPKKTVDGMTVFITNGGYVGVDESAGNVNGFSVCGEGDSFLVYSLAAICILEDANDAFISNVGTVTSAYLMCRFTKEEYANITSCGTVFLIKPYENKYMFVINR